MDLPDKFVHCPRVFSFSTMVKQAPTHIGVQPNCFVCLILSSISFFSPTTHQTYTHRERERTVEMEGGWWQKYKLLCVGRCIFEIVTIVRPNYSLHTLFFAVAY